MTLILILGAITTILGLAGLAYCIREAAAVRKGGMEPAQAQAKLRSLVAVNLGSVAVATLGLALVVVGLIL